MVSRVFAVGAHPDDVEFVMAGTLILLRDAGYEVHILAIGNGSCGSSTLPAEEIIAIRREEARRAAAQIGGIYHEGFVNDIEILFATPLLARVGAVMREVAPEILLVPSPSDYMEDHQNAARLAVTAAFCRGMPNFPTDPPRPPVALDVTVYHAQPHSNRDPLGVAVRPGLFVDIGSVLERKRAMLSCHQSQKRWLDESQGMDSYLQAMEDMSRDVGEMSGGRFRYAEGWRKRFHPGFCAADAGPLERALGERVLTV